MKLFSLRFLRSRRFWQRSAFTFACLATLIAAACAIENYRGRSAWENYLHEAESRGAKLGLKNLIKPPIADEENFAALPLFQELSSRDKRVKGRAYASVGLPDIPNADALWRPGSHGELRLDFSVLREALVKAGFLDSTSNNPAADVLRALDRYEPVLKDLRKAARERPRNQPKAGWEKGPDADIYHMRGIIDLARLLSFRASALAALGRTPEALEEWHTLLRLCEMYASDLTLFTGMTRVVMLSLITGPVRTGLVDGRWTAAQLQEINTALGKMDLRKDYTSMIDGERAWSNGSMDYYLAANPFPSRSLPLIPTGWIYQNRVRINRIFDRAIEANRSGISLEAIDREYSREPAYWWKRPYSFLLSTMLFGLGDNQMVTNSAQAEISLARIACAIELYRMRTGTQPAQLSDLIPSELNALPSDPFINAPFQYRPRSDGTYALYSVASDGHDNGGDPELDQGWNRNPASSNRE